MTFTAAKRVRHMGVTAPAKGWKRMLQAGEAWHAWLEPLLA